MVALEQFSCVCVHMRQAIPQLGVPIELGLTMQENILIKISHISSKIKKLLMNLLVFIHPNKKGWLNQKNKNKKTS